ncbi:MAG: signal peptidase II [Alphaproteobacteria bacterium]|nr:signal peptidase II [Alphaproteobacteria bacterium]
MLWGFIAIICALAIDLGSKYMIAEDLIATPAVYGAYFNLVKVWNTGVSFSMFNNHGVIGAVCLSIFAAAISIFLLYWMYHENDKIRICALGMIIGGAWGNIIDRIHYGAVLDFLDFHYENLHWPAFNFADTFICIGAGILIVMEIYKGRMKGKQK